MSLQYIKAENKEQLHKLLRTLYDKKDKGRANKA